MNGDCQHVDRYSIQQNTKPRPCQHQFDRRIPEIFFSIRSILLPPSLSRRRASDHARKATNALRVAAVTAITLGHFRAPWQVAAQDTLARASSPPPWIGPVSRARAGHCPPLARGPGLQIVPPSPPGPRAGLAASALTVTGPSPTGTPALPGSGGAATESEYTIRVPGSPSLTPLVQVCKLPPGRVGLGVCRVAGAGSHHHDDCLIMQLAGPGRV
jgi:hypothetical protein